MPKIGNLRGYPPKIEDLPEIRPNSHVKVMLIGKSLADKSITVHTHKQKNSKLSIPPFTAYGGIDMIGTIVHECQKEKLQ